MGTVLWAKDCGHGENTAMRPAQVEPTWPGGQSTGEPVCAGRVPTQMAGLGKFLEAAELRNTKTQQVKDQKEQSVPGGENSTCRNLKVKAHGPFKRTRFHLAAVQRPEKGQHTGRGKVGGTRHKGHVCRSDRSGLSRPKSRRHQ